MLNISIYGDRRVIQELNKLYPTAADKAVENANKILFAVLNRYVKAAPYNYLSWAQGGPGSFGGFFSEAQRRFVMAKVASGEFTIPYPRTGKDHYQLSGTGRSQTIRSDDISMYYSMSDEGQAQMQAMRGWDKISVFLDGHRSDIMDAFDQGVKEAISEVMSHTAP